MSTIATLAVKLVGETSGFTQAMAEAERTAKTTATNIGKNLQKIGGDITNMGKTATMGLTLPIAGMAVMAVNAASDLEETKNKVTVVFGDMSTAVLDWSKDSAKAFGMSQNQALEAAGTYGNLFLTLGMGQRPAKEMSTNLIELASDLASFNNANPDEVLAALQSGLIGQSEPMRKFGVNLNEAAVAAKAMQMGLVDTTVDMTKVNGLMLDSEKATEKLRIATAWYGEDSLQAREEAQNLAEIQKKLEEATAGSVGEMTEAAKVQARYALMLEQTTTAQGDFARTAGGLANMTRSAKAQFADTAAVLGEQLLPYALQLANWVKDMISKFQALGPEQQRMIMIFAGVAAAIGPVLMIVGSLVSAIGALIPVITAVAGALSIPLIVIIAAVAAAIFLLYKAWTENWGGIREKVAAVIAFLKPLFEQFIGNLVALWQNVLLPALQAVWQWMSTVLFPYLKALGNFIGAVLGLAVKILAGIWQNVLWPALKTFIEWAQKNVIPVLKPIADFFGKVFKAAIEGITTAIKTLTGWLKTLTDKLLSIKLPKWMTPGSPTPWELGLLGVSAALGELARSQLPTFATALELSPVMIGGQQAAMSGAMGTGGGMGFGGGGMVFNINVASDGITDEKDVARKIGSAVNVILRERGLA